MQTKKALLIPLLPLCVFFFLMLSEKIDTEILTGVRSAYLSFIIIQLICILLPTIFFCKLRGDDYVFRLQLRVFGLEKAVFLVFSVFVMIFAMTAAELGMQSLGVSGGIFSHSVFSLYGRPVPELGTNVYDTIYTLIVFAVIPSFTEELLFRSVLYTEYECCGAPCAVILTALLYGMLGMDVVSFVPSFVGGLILGFIVYITQSVFASFLVHLLYNLYALFFQEYIWAFIAKPENKVFFVFILLTSLLVASIFALAQAERVIYDRGVRGEAVPGYIKVKEEGRQFSVGGVPMLLRAALSPSYLACFVFFAARAADWF